MLKVLSLSWSQLPSSVHLYLHTLSYYPGKRDRLVESTQVVREFFFQPTGTVFWFFRDDHNYFTVFSLEIIGSVEIFQGKLLNLAVVCDSRRAFPDSSNQRRGCLDTYLDSFHSVLNSAPRYVSLFIRGNVEFRYLALVG